MCDVWIEKYRPQVLADVEGNPATIQRLKNIASDGNMPNLLIAGPPGTGKTTSVLALARALLGEQFKRAVMELNASDDRGIDVVRDRIKSFAKEKVDLPPGRHKIVILDEVDAMTEVAQQALRRLMEVHSDSTRFALACNQSTKIIEPIQSRCAIIRYGRLQDHQIFDRSIIYRFFEGCYISVGKRKSVPYINLVVATSFCAQIDYVDSGLDALIFTAEGDMRNAINNLQSTVNGFELVNKENVTKVCDMPPPESIKSLIGFCLGAKWKDAHQISNSLIDEGYTPSDIVMVMKSVLRRSDNIAEALCLEYLKLVSRCHFTMIDGVASPLQLDALLTNLCSTAVEFSKVT